VQGTGSGPQIQEEALSSIPIIDLGLVAHASTRSVSLSQLEAACRTACFFYVANHGVAPDLIAQAFEQAVGFFERHMAEKMAIHLRRILYVAALTDMPNVTGEMIDWWFAWHDTDQAYTLWHPRDHISAVWRHAPDRSKS
jgi:isopenicillin N synthase-like dioxygenase